MKIVLFRNGAPGIRAEMMGGDMELEEQFETLLGGATEMEPIRANLVLLHLRNGRRIGLPEHYTLRQRGMEDIPIWGDCAAVALDYYGQYMDIGEDTMNRALRTVLPAGIP